jgi:GT2 family glycosyltransferase
MVDVSVIIVNRNTKQKLCDCLKSIFGQPNNYSLEVIVVDNASSDNSQLMIKSEFPSVHLIENEQNVGFARANNIGIKKSTGRYLALINSDVVVLKDCIEKLILRMDENADVGIAGPKILNADNSLQPSCRRFPSLWNNFCQAVGLEILFPRVSFFGGWSMKYSVPDSTKSVDALSGCFWMVRRKSLDDVGLLDERFFMYGEDLDWCKRFHESGWGVTFSPDSQAIHFGGASSACAPIKFYLEMQKADLQYWEKHHGRLKQVCYGLIIFLRHLIRIVLLAVIYLVRPQSRSRTSFKLRRSIACIQWLLCLRTIESE